MYRHRHAVALAICLAMALSLFVSSAFIMHEATHHHDCIGDDCPVCRVIAQAEHVCRSFSVIVAVLLLVHLALTMRREWHAFHVPAQPVFYTLVSRKIRLND